MIFIGIDPGITGGIAAIDDKGAVRLCEHMPTMPSPVAAKRNMVNGREVAAMVRGLAPEGPVHVALERVGAMPRQSPVSMFSFGTSWGIVIGVLEASALPYTLVLPQKWKGHHGLGADKAQAIGLAMRLWPGITLKKSDDGPAEALLIADWLRAGYVKG